MGTFARLYRENGMNIPDEKIEEFKERLEVLYQVGGMMELESIFVWKNDRHDTQGRNA